MYKALKIRLVAYGIVALVFAFGAGLAAHASTAGAQAPPPPMPPANIHAPQPSRPLGAPAIQPHPFQGRTGSGSAFTKEDVVQWVTTHHVGQSKASRTPTSVVTVEFIANAELENRLDVTTGLPSTDPVCYVRLHGDFMILGAGTSVMTHDGYLLFDGQTGNLLMYNV
jgi:hypothetical protein